MVWIIVYWWGGIGILLTILESLHAATTRFDTLLLLIIIALGQIFIGTGVLIAQGSVRVLPFFDNVVAVGIGTLLTLIGAAGMTYCRYAMGRLWSAATALHGEHRVIDTGLWGIIRHPLYAFVLVMYLGTALVFSTWWEWIVR
jgi:protein-S-isoprenylcysteine O-methyltransferase Ste14